MKASATAFVPEVGAEETADDSEGKEKAEPGSSSETKKASVAASGSQGTSAVGACTTDKSESAIVPGTDVWRPQYQGRIRSFNEQKGFGFIDCQATLQAFGRDVFIHRFQMAECGLWIGQEVGFEVELNKNGQPQARNIQPVDPAGSTSWDYQNMGTGYGTGWNGQYDYGYMKGGGQGHNAQGSFGTGNAMSGAAGADMASEPMEEMLWKCSGSTDLWEIIEQYGHSFGKKHVVIALYKLGLCRHYERRSRHASLTSLKRPSVFFGHWRPWMRSEGIPEPIDLRWSSASKRPKIVANSRPRRWPAL
jgi:cold shock CspA family protein